MTDPERCLAYTEVQANHPDPQLRPLLAFLYGPALRVLRAVVEREHVEKTEEANSSAEPRR